MTLMNALEKPILDPAKNDAGAFPFCANLSGEAAEHVAGIPIKAFASEMPGLGAITGYLALIEEGKAGSESILAEHYAFFSRDIPNIEGLVNLESLVGEEEIVFVDFPLKFENGDGGPTRAAALLYEATMRRLSLRWMDPPGWCGRSIASHMGDRKMTRFWLCLLLLVALGCGGPPAERPAVDLQAARSALMKADAALFAGHEDVDRFFTFWADDAIFMPDDAPVARGDSIRTTWEQLISRPGFDLAWQVASAEVAKAGGMGYTIGTYELTVEQGGVSMVTVGKYVTIWERQADASWKVVVDCFHADGPFTEG
jgi:ketosteroid isomerase-like protein